MKTLTWKVKLKGLEGFNYLWTCKSFHCWSLFKIYFHSLFSLHKWNLRPIDVWYQTQCKDNDNCFFFPGMVRFHILSLMAYFWVFWKQGRQSKSLEDFQVSQYFSHSWHQKSDNDLFPVWQHTTRVRLSVPPKLLDPAQRICNQTWVHKILNFCFCKGCVHFFSWCQKAVFCIRWGWLDMRGDAGSIL